MNTKNNKLKIKQLLQFTLKLGLGLALVGYVLKSKMIDYGQLGKLLSDPKQWFVALFFILFSTVCCVLRWYLLIRAQGIQITQRTTFALTMIGAFFNTFMPGSVGGDVIKAWYVTGRTPGKKPHAIMSVFMDRLIGLAVIIFYGAITLFFYRDILPEHPALKTVAWISWAFTLLSLVGLALFLTPHFWKLKPVLNLKQILSKKSWVAELVESVFVYQKHRGAVLLSLLLSCISILGMNLFYIQQGSQMGITLATPLYFFIVPLALIFSAIPLLPGGIGTGQIAFFTLFAWAGHATPTDGSSLCTVIQIYMIVFNLIGGIFYLKFRRTPETHQSKMQTCRN